LTIDTAQESDVILRSVETKHNSDIHSIQKKIEDIVSEKVNQLIDKVKTENRDVPVILVGGGSPILPSKIKGVSDIIRPDHYEVANAFGACIAQISGEAEKVFNLNNITRDEAIEEMKQVAIQKAIGAGAKSDTIEVLTILDTPLAYLPNTIKVKVKVCGDL